MSAGMVKDHKLEKHLDKQMGCMAGFLQLFDRHQILSGKRSYSTKRLPPPHVVDTTSDSEKSGPPSPAFSKEFGKPPRPEWSPAAAELPTKSPLRIPIFELKEGTARSWKFSKETPRLSLDSRATTDAKGGLHPKEIRTAAASIIPTANLCESVASDVTDESQQHRSPCVIARLMGLEPLPGSSSPEPGLRRSASESRVSRDLFHSRFISEGSGFSSNQLGHFNSILKDNSQFADPRNHLQRNANKADLPKDINRGSYTSSSPWKAPHSRRSFVFDSGDIFPEPKQSSVSIYGDIENKLKMRGIDEPSKDLETLKQILEALQLKGLLHSRKQSERNHFSRQNFVYDDSPIVVMKPSRSPISTPIGRRTANEYSYNRYQCRGSRRDYSHAGENSPSRSPRRDPNVRNPISTRRNPTPTTTARSEDSALGRRSNSLVKPKPLSVETHRRMNESTENRRVSPIHSPKLNPRRTGPDPAANLPSPTNKKKTTEINRKEKKITTVIAAEDESSSVSGSSITTSTDTERLKTEEYKQGRNLLERCDKLLHSIAEMTASDMQPSPVSVLDSSFYKDESSTPSPITTRLNIDFKDHSGELEEELWSLGISPVKSKCKEMLDDCDFVYVSDILRASHYLPEGSDVFLLLEKQQYLKGKDICKVSRLQRKLIFHTINEILDGKQQLPPWKAVLWTDDDCAKPCLTKVWSEFQRMQEHESGDDLFQTICGVLKKDLARDGIIGWGDCPVEMSEVVLDMERLVFKDLISEIIREVAALASRNTLTSIIPRRKLVF